MKTMAGSLKVFGMATALLLSGLAVDVAAATLYARTNGTDTAGCGSSSHPCRTISAAVRAAADGDRIVVGPGRYGDLNGNGVVDPETRHSTTPATA